jgi:hypothetical protein
MNWEDIKKMIGQVAPTLGAAIGAIVPVPGGAAIGGLAGSILKQIFGTDSPEQLTQVISQDPQAALKLREAELTFQLEMAKIDLEKFKVDLEETKSFLADVQSARTRQTEHEKATGKTDVNLYILAWVLVGGFLGLTSFLIWFAYQGKPIVDQSGVLYMLLGTMSTAFGMVVGYFFGSSKGSADRAAAIDKLLKK